MNFKFIVPIKTICKCAIKIDLISKNPIIYVLKTLDIFDILLLFYLSSTKFNFKLMFYSTLKILLLSLILFPKNNQMNIEVANSHQL